MFGAWGDSVPSGLLQLRALDWDVDGPYKDHALIVVYHADKVNNNPNSFINVGFVGWVGSISGTHIFRLEAICSAVLTICLLRHVLEPNGNF